MSIKRNMGLEDRTVRPVVAMGLIGLCLNETTSPLVKGALLAVSAALVITSLTGKCPAYQVMGVNTRKDSGNGARQLFM